MELLHLETFIQLVRKGSFSGVARDMGVSQPTVTVRIKALERDLGVALVARVGNRVSPTPAGRILFESATRGMLALQHGLDGVRGTSARGGRQLILAASPTTSTYYLPERLARLQAAHPGLEITLHSRLSPEVIDLVMAGVVHVGFIRRTLEHPEVACLPVYRDPLCLVARAGHRLAGAPAVTAYDLAREPILAYTRDLDLYYLIENIFRSRGVRPDVRMQLGHVATLKQMVLAGNGLSFLPRIAVEAELRAGTLVELALDALAGIELTNSLVVLKKAVQAPPVRELIELCTAKRC